MATQEEQNSDRQEYILKRFLLEAGFIFVVIMRYIMAFIIFYKQVHIYI